MAKLQLATDRCVFQRPHAPELEPDRHAATLPRRTPRTTLRLPFLHAPPLPRTLWEDLHILLRCRCCFLPHAIVAAASVAVAHPVDDQMFAARGDGEVALSERDIQILGHFAREYLAAQSNADLYLSKSARSDLKDSDIFEREYLEPELVAQGPLDRSQREHYKTFDEYEKVFLE
ncbi:hypothetical protein EVJ58_g11050 [Rhodofomes roseus]|uniref:Uncharacterized protein n=1 Tax=Rhodofomes roseus TaxID=34475 RepID=A0A4Y9XM77_9APHY|nr:hypothetical protein EVJ58_g11050 [Rhodofomes roseus]